MDSIMEIDWINVLDMSVFLMAWGIGIILVVIVSFVILSEIYETWLFATSGNPYRRTCRKCGQQQQAYGRTYNKSQWWEDTLPEPDKDCVCHSFSTDFS